MSKANPIASTSLKAIMNKRVLISADHEGKRIKFFVQGNGNVIDVVNKLGEPVLSTIKGSEGIILQKKIFNLRANSHVAMSNARTRQMLMDGLAAEKAGNVELADEHFNNYLNATQVSFGVILPSAISDKLTAGTQIAATVQKITTENGSLLTIDPSSISIMAPESAGATSFNLEDFLPAVTEGAAVKDGAVAEV